MTITAPRLNPALLDESRAEAEAAAASLRQEMAFVESFGTRGTDKSIARLMTEKPRIGA